MLSTRADGMETSDKYNLRSRMRELIRAVTPEERAAFSRSLCDNALTQPLWQNSRAVLFFAPLPDEPDLTPLLDAAWREGKTVARPRYDSNTRQ